MPDTTPSNPASAALSEIRERQARIGTARQGSRYDPLIAVAYEDAPRLIAALEAVLKEAGKWDVIADRLGTHHSRHRAFKMCASEVREAITRELAKGEGWRWSLNAGPR